MPERGPGGLVWQNCELGIHQGFYCASRRISFHLCSALSQSPNPPFLQQHDLETARLSLNEHGSTNSTRVCPLFVLAQSPLLLWIRLNAKLYEF